MKIIPCGLIALMSAFEINAQDITTGLVAEYKFDGDLSDSSGYDLNLSSSGGEYNFVSDHLGNAVSAVQLVTAASNGTFFVGTGPTLANRSSTVSFWMRKDYVGNGTNGSWVFGLGHPAGVGGSAGQDMHVAVDYGSSVRYAFFYNDLDISTPLPDYAWFNITATFDEQTFERKIFINGLLAGSDIAAFGFSGSNALKVGYQGTTLDDLVFYDRALSSDDVLALVQIPEANDWASICGLAVVGAAQLKKRRRSESK